MARITLIDKTGARREIEAKTGQTVMEAATRNNVAGIIAECGGSCSCATCHVHVDVAWLPRLKPRSEDETAMLEFAEGADEFSRLSCQIKVTDELDGFLATVADNG
jgi:2Fe-2S ferredoxin